MSAELLDIVNENNQVIGQEEREMIHQTGLWHRGIHIFLFTPERKLLVQQRSLHQKLSPGTLDCSVSEHLLAGESYLDAARRGLREELGIEPIPIKSRIQFKMNYGPNDNLISTLYEGIINSDKTKIDLNEVANIMYYSLPELQELLLQRKNPFSRWFQQLILWYLGKPSEIKIITGYQEF
jgi:isopentenyl-diphosphate Delta-isomerase